MSAEDEIIRRWRLNAAAAGVRLSEEDIARIVGHRRIEHVRLVEAIVERCDAREVVPDYLDILATQPATQAGERGNG
jgi:hypothetical protein